MRPPRPMSKSPNSISGPWPANFILAMTAASDAGGGPSKINSTTARSKTWSLHCAPRVGPPELADKFRTEADYLQKNAERMRYPEYRRQGSLSARASSKRGLSSAPVSNSPACSGPSAEPMRSSPSVATASAAALKITGRRAGPDLHFYVARPPRSIVSGSPLHRFYAGARRCRRDSLSNQRRAVSSLALVSAVPITFFAPRISSPACDCIKEPDYPCFSGPLGIYIGPWRVYEVSSAVRRNSVSCLPV